MTMALLSVPDGGKKYLALLMSALFAAPVAAQEKVVPKDTFQPYVAAMVNYDDNLLRRDTNARAEGGYSDTYKTTLIGLGVEWPIGRQILTADVKATKVNFNRFSQLDYNGRDGFVDLNWRVGNHFSGNVGAKYLEALASFADFPTAELNVRTVKTVYADGKWQFHPSWRATAGINNKKYHFDLESQRFNNRSEDTSDVGIDYLAKSGSFIGLLARRLDGKYDVDNIGPGGVVLRNGYTQDSLNININWLASGVTQVTFLGGYAKRKHDSNSLRDVNGAQGRLIANWTPRASVKVVGAVWREFSASEGVFVNSAIATGASVDAAWLITSKINVNGQLRTEKRDFEPLPGVPIFSDLTDNTRMATLGVTYEPVRQISLNLNTFHTSRSGSAAAFTNSYRAKGIGFSASVKF
ncbi:MAG: XrtB/PEP-CTERM-associated polysaccharide biosynthesis outer membrane protein EpsL [Duganella sp.]